MSNRLRTPASRRRELLVRSILALAVCVAVAMAFNGSTSSLRQIARSFGISVVYAGCTAALGYLTLPRIGPGCGRLPAPWDWTVFLAACVAIAIAGCLLSVALLAALGIFPLSVYWRAFAASVWLCIAITLAFGIGNFLYESMRAQLERAMLEEERARFSSLESRIHPHFLFNTLNSISALIREDPGKAEQTVQQLSALLRYSLDTHTSGLTRLGKELRIVADYLEIERTRFGDRLKFSIDAPGALEDLELPPMAIQTLVENSIKHAVSQQPRRRGNPHRGADCRGQVPGRGLGRRPWIRGERYAGRSRPRQPARAPRERVRRGRLAANLFGRRAHNRDPFHAPEARAGPKARADMMRAFVLDDEPLAVRRLQRMLEETGRVEIAGAGSDPVDAVEWLSTHTVDVLFLDIQMPGLSGFEALAMLNPQPLVGFTTAYDQYGLQAFEVNSIDYLLKPIEERHLARALDKIERLSAGGQAQDLATQLASLLQSRSPEYPGRIASRLGDKLQFVDLDQVTHFFAQDKLTYAATEAKNYVVSYAISELEQKLDPKQFCRIHRATLLNLAYVQELDAWFGGRVLARLKDGKGTELEGSRDRVPEL